MTRNILRYTIDDDRRLAELTQQQVTIKNKNEKAIQIMRGFKEKDGIKVDYQQKYGETQEEQERKQKDEAVKSKYGPGQTPNAPFPGRSISASGGFILKVGTLIKLLEKSHQRKCGDGDRNEIEKRIGDDKIN